MLTQVRSRVHEQSENINKEVENIFKSTKQTIKLKKIIM
jgi:hypothetical protein